jgi:hypothetical protein
MTPVVNKIPLLILLLLLATPALRAATEHSGRVTLGGVPVPGARVVASQGDHRVTLSTGPDGTYRFTAPVEGVWTIRVEMIGFSTLTKDVTIGGGNGTPETWELTILPFADITRGLPPPPPPAPPQPTERPRGSNSRRQTASSGQPNGSASAAPAGSGFQRAGVTSTATPAGASAAGAARPAPPISAGFADEAGSAAGAGDSLLVSGSVNTSGSQPTLGNVRVLSGVRLYSGRVTVQGSTSALDAAPYSMTGTPAVKPDQSYLNLGVNFSGPMRIPGLMRNQKNFSFNFNRTTRNSAATRSEIMPTVLQRSGDFSQTLDARGLPVTIVDPLTGLSFPGNVIPADRISPQALALLQYYPEADPAATGLRNYQIPAPTSNHSMSAGASVSNLITNNTNLLGLNGSYQRNGNDSTSLFGFEGTNAGSGFNININYTRRFLPSNQQVRFRYGFNRQSSTSKPYFAFRTNVSGDAGIEGNNQDPANWGPPSLSFSATSIAGLSDGIYSLNRTQTHTFGAETTRTRGRQTFAFGGNGRLTLLDLVSQQNPRGRFTFNGALTGHDFADFLLGYPNTSSIAYGNADKYFRARNFDAYVTDDFRVNPGLTINMGVRWEYEVPVTELYGRLVNLDVAPDFSAAAPVVAADGVGPITGRRYPKSLVESDPFGIQPRVGVAWRPVLTSSVVLRAGYGLYRNTGLYQSIATQMAQQPPLSEAFNSTSTLETPLTLANGFIAPVSTTRNTVAIDPEFRPGIVHRWETSAQRDLPAGLTVIGTYFGGKGFRLPQSFLPNTYAPGAPNPCPSCPSGFVYTQSTGSSIQHAGRVELRRRLRAGLTWMTRYTLTDATDNASGFSGPGGGQPAQDWLNLDAERAPSAVQRHALEMTANYTTGQTPSTGSMLTGTLGNLLVGWGLSLQLQTGSGTPYTPTYLVTSVAGVTGSVRGNLTGAPIDAAPDGYYANPAAFAAPEPGTWGTAQRNSIRGPARFSLNANISKNFQISTRQLNWQISLTNLLNQVTYSTIDASVGSPQFGLPIAANEMRRINTSFSTSF